MPTHTLHTHVHTHSSHIYGILGKSVCYIQLLPRNTQGQSPNNQQEIPFSCCEHKGHFPSSNECHWRWISTHVMSLCKNTKYPSQLTAGFPYSSAGKESACNAGDPGLIPRLGRSLEKGKATHSSILAWRIPWTIPLGSQRIEHD